ncbi:glycosyltransferase family 2 protein [Ruminococcaceae bacterium OttesenSCG-928-N02]|nr:glycosyltransferase family 2 protein [Ruminococcaceae bacterium OttesenSCG-928-N02]
MKILVLIPCYNEQENIAQVLARLQTTRPDVDYLVINDCSTDKSEAILRAGGHNYISLPVNVGIGGGVQSGYLYAVEHGYDITIQMDGDGQHSPKYLSAVCEPIISGEMDMCIGSRFVTKEGFQTSFMRRVGIRFLSALIRVLCGAKVKDVTSGYRACNKELTAFFAANYAQDYPEPEAIVAAHLNGFRLGEVPVVMKERQGGASSITTLRSAYYMVKVSLSLITYRLSFGKRKERTAHDE